MLLNREEKVKERSLRVCLSYYSMIRHHDQGNLEKNLLTVYSFRGLESKTITMGAWQQADRLVAGALSGSLHLDP